MGAEVSPRFGGYGEGMTDGGWRPRHPPASFYLHIGISVVFLCNRGVVFRGGEPAISCYIYPGRVSVATFYIGFSMAFLGRVYLPGTYPPPPPRSSPRKSRAER